MISIIAAIGKNRELGKNNRLLWHIPEDMDRFKKLTSGQVVIMGRKTYESLPPKFRPLPNRINIVISHKSNLSNESNTSNLTHWTNSIEQALDLAKQEAPKETYIIGGAQIYELGIKYADRLFLTLVDQDFPDADAFFPDYREFGKELIVGEGMIEGLKYKFVELTK